MRRVWCVRALATLRASTAAMRVVDGAWVQRRSSSGVGSATVVDGGDGSSAAATTTTTTTGTAAAAAGAAATTIAGAAATALSGGTAADVASDADTHPDFHPRIIADRLASDEVAAIKQDMVDTIASEDIVVFIKGLPEAPMCAFSKRIIDVLEALGVEYTSFDVLAHPIVRVYVKELSEWPTIPQLFVKGQFTGGVDIVLRMAETGDLQMLLDSKGIAHRDQSRAQAAPAKDAASTTAGESSTR